MTVSTTENTKIFTGDGVTDEYDFPYKTIQSSHITITIDDVETSAWSAIGYGNSAGISITFTSPPANGTEIVIQRIVPYTQDTDLSDDDGNPAEVTEGQFDLFAMANQQLAEQISRAILFPVTVTEFDSTFPVPVANRAIMINPTANGFAVSTYNPDEQVTNAAASAVEAAASAVEAATSASEAADSATALASQTIRFSVTTGSSNAYVVTTGDSLTSLTTGMKFVLKLNHSNTGAATLNVDGIGAVAIKKNITTDVANGDLQSGAIVTVVFDGTNFVLDNTSILKNTPAFSAIASGSQTVTTNVITKLNIVTENWDYGSCYDASNSRFTPTTAGIYLFIWVAGFVDAGSSAQGCVCNLGISGATNSRIATSRYFDNGDEFLTGSAMVEMDGSTDYAEVYGLISGTGANTIILARFMACKLDII